MTVIKEWARQNPRRAVGRVLVILANFLLVGSLFAMAGIGPLNGSVTLMLVLGTLGGLLAVALWVWQTGLVIRGEGTRARRAAAWLVAVPVGVFLLAGGLALVQTWLNGMSASPGGDRVRTFERLWAAVNRNYPHFAVKEVDWQAVHDNYLPRVQAAEDDAAYFAAIADMMGELKDGHSGLISPMNYRMFGQLREIGGKAVVIKPGQTASAAGLQRGDEIVAVDGLPVEQAIEKLPVYLRNGSSPWNRRAIAVSNLLYVPSDGDLEVTFETPAGEQHTVRLVPAAVNSQPAGEEKPEPVVAARQLPSGVGVIQVRQLWARGDEDISAAFDAALNDLMDAPGIILDVRGNGGGSSLIGDDIAGRFLEQRFDYGVEHFRAKLPFRLWRSRFPYHAAPREPVYRGPLVILTDALTFSSAEMMVAALRDAGRARTVGQTTGGGSGNPIVFNLPGGGKARYSTASFYRSNGQPVEGVGIAADIVVEQTLAAFRAGKDLQLDAAEQAILNP